MTIVNGSQAEESFRRWEEERKAKRNNYWIMLKRARKDYLELTQYAAGEVDTGIEAFYYFLQQNYGLKIELIDGKIAGEYVVTDEKKYVMFLLKYG